MAERLPSGSVKLDNTNESRKTEHLEEVDHRSLLASVLVDPTDAGVLVAITHRTPRVCARIRTAVAAPPHSLTGSATATVLDPAVVEAGDDAVITLMTHPIDSTLLYSSNCEIAVAATAFGGGANRRWTARTSARVAGLGCFRYATEEDPSGFEGGDDPSAPRTSLPDELASVDLLADPRNCSQCHPIARAQHSCDPANVELNPSVGRAIHSKRAVCPGRRGTR